MADNSLKVGNLDVKFNENQIEIGGKKYQSTTVLLDLLFEKEPTESIITARRNYPRRKVDIRWIDETCQADLVFMEKYSRENKGFKYILTIIDNFSKYAWAVALKDKTGLAVAKALTSVFKQGRVPKKLHVDQGGEFYNKNCKDLFRKHKIHLYSTFSNLKASIIERFNRTLKTNMYKRFSLQGSFKWHDIL